MSKFPVYKSRQWYALHHDPTKCYRCKYCKEVDFDMFMVNDILWLKVATKKKDLICIKCFESKLGRSLVLKDFTKVPVNKCWIGKLKHVKLDKSNTAS